ncbi:PRC-barrel domain-containing protein [Cellulosimicrobium sp. Marseille-Q8652]
MILSDLLDAPVVGADGARRGFVVDVRLVLDLLAEDDGPGGPRDREDASRRDVGRDGGPDDEPLSASTAGRGAVGDARVVGILVSPRRAGSFHGYERTEVRSPWPIPQLVRHRHRGTYLVRWEDVTGVGPEGVRLAAGYAEHDPALGAATV